MNFRIIVCAIAALAIGSFAGAATISVPGDHATVTAALAAANPNDTIQITVAGEYDGQLIINKSVTIEATVPGVVITETSTAPDTDPEPGVVMVFGDAGPVTMAMRGPSASDHLLVQPTNELWHALVPVQHATNEITCDFENVTFDSTPRDTGIIGDVTEKCVNPEGVNPGAKLTASFTQCNIFSEGDGDTADIGEAFEFEGDPINNEWNFTDVLVIGGDSGADLDDPIDSVFNLTRTTWIGRDDDGFVNDEGGNSIFNIIDSSFTGEGGNKGFVADNTLGGNRYTFQRCEFNTFGSPNLTLEFECDIDSNPDFAEFYNCLFKASWLDAAPGWEPSYVFETTNARFVHCTFISEPGVDPMGFDRIAIQAYNGVDGSTRLTNISVQNCVFDDSINYPILLEEDGGSPKPATSIGVNIFGHTASALKGPIGGSAIIADPQFVDAPNEDYHLAATSPGLGVGLRTFLNLIGNQDLDAEARPQPANTWPDLGCYEEPTAFVDPPFSGARHWTLFR